MESVSKKIENSLASNLRRMMRYACLMTCFSVGLSSTVTAQQEQCADDVMLVFDGSGSMAEMGFNGLDRPRIFDAREAMNKIMPQVASDRKIGLITYGPGAGDACSNVNLRFTPQKDAGPRIIAEVENLTPGGKTPLTNAVKDAAEVLNYREKTGVVVLVTDGKETCGGATCQLANELSRYNKNITVHVIGFLVLNDFFKWNSQKTEEDVPPPAIAQCLADGTGGKYYSANSTEELVSALQETLTCPLIGSFETDSEIDRWMTT